MPLNNHTPVLIGTESMVCLYSINGKQGWTMNKRMIVLAVLAAFTTAASASNLSGDEYKAGKDKIAAEFKAEKQRCDSMAGNAKDICVAEANGNEKVAKAELEARHKNTAKAHYEARIAKAEADYRVAKEKCDDLSGNQKDVCLKDAKAAETRAKADAKASHRTSQLNNSYADKRQDINADASADKRDANYAVAKEKCDSYAGDAKDQCMSDAKRRYGK